MSHSIQRENMLRNQENRTIPTEGLSCCSSCGGIPPTKVYFKYIQGANNKLYTVKCPECGFMSEWRNSLYKAVYLWNTLEGI